MTNSNWVIYNDTEKLFWSNELGWTEFRAATVFTRIERLSLTLPIDGKWMRRIN